jgi:hypothetical protein
VRWAFDDHTQLACSTTLNRVMSTCCARCRCPILLQTLEHRCQKTSGVMGGGSFRANNLQIWWVGKLGTSGIAEELSQSQGAHGRFFLVFIRGGQVWKTIECRPRPTPKAPPHRRLQLQW